MTYRSKYDKVLVVDDDRALGEMLSLVLDAEGWKSRVVRTGDQVLPEFLDFKPDVVLLDWMLPGLDGVTVCRQIRLHIRRADHHAYGPLGHPRRGGRLGGWGRRLHHQTVQEC